MKRLIVNESDEVIGAKSRDVIDFSKDIYRVSALWLTNTQGEVLIAQRGFELSNGAGLYGPAVAGTVEENETYESNIYKEAEEEIGLRGVKLVSHQKFRRSGRRNYFCQFFTATVDWKANEFVLHRREVEVVAWVQPDALKKDIALHPEKYVESMKQAVQLFCEAKN